MSEFVFKLFRPSFWVELHPTCEIWDAKLLKLMEEHKPRFSNLIKEYKIANN